MHDSSLSSKIREPITVLKWTREFRAMIPSSCVTIDNDRKDIECVIHTYLDYVAVDTGETKILWQMTSAQHSHMQRFLVDRMNDLNAHFRLQIHRTIQRRGHGLQTCVYKTFDPRQSHSRRVLLNILVVNPCVPIGSEGSVITHDLGIDNS